MKIVMLTTFENPWGLEMIRCLQEADIHLSAVLCSRNPKRDEKFYKILEERTRGHYTFPALPDVLGKKPLPFYFVKTHNDQLSEATLKYLEPDLLVLGGADIIKQHILDIPVVGTINMHPGLLPEYRGCSSVEWALLNDDYVGSTCHFVTTEIDAGAVLFKDIMPICKGDSYEVVRAGVLIHAAQTLVKAIKALQNGEKGKTFPPERGNYYKTMDNDMVEEVKKKMLDGKYKLYQTRKNN